VCRSGRHGSPDRARSQWGSARLRTRVRARACSDPSVPRPTMASQRVSGHRDPDSERSKCQHTSSHQCTASRGLDPLPKTLRSDHGFFQRIHPSRRGERASAAVAMQCGTVGPEQTVGSVLAHLVGRRRMLRCVDQVGLRSDLRARAAFAADQQAQRREGWILFQKPCDRIMVFSSGSIPHAAVVNGCERSRRVDFSRFVRLTLVVYCAALCEPDSFAPSRL
jgi:hypothetical protein